MRSQGRNTWTDDTVPTRRVSPDAQRETEGQRPSSVLVWLLGFIVFVLVLAVLGFWGVYLLREQWAELGPTPTYVIWTPTPAPTPVATSTPVPPTVAPTEVLPTVSPGVVIGGFVKVSGTEGTGVSLRSGPGANYPRMDVGLEGELFLVVSGPASAGDAQWWELRDPENESRQYWAVANFLEPVANP